MKDIFITHFWCLTGGRKNLDNIDDIYVAMSKLKGKYLWEEEGGEECDICFDCLKN